MITREIAETLKHGDILEHRFMNNIDGTPKRARVNGKCKTWKRNYDAFSIPVKHGLSLCFNITEQNGVYWRVKE